MHGHGGHHHRGPDGHHHKVPSGYHHDVHHHGSFRGHGCPPPPPPHRGYGRYGGYNRYHRYRGPYGNPGCLGGCLTFILGSGGIIALIVLALCAIF